MGITVTSVRGIVRGDVPTTPMKEVETKDVEKQSEEVETLVDKATPKKSVK